MIREVFEETGIDVSKARGGFVFSYHRENPGEGDNYFVDIYRFVTDFTEEDVVLQPEENTQFEIADTGRIRQYAEEGIFLHYESIKRVFY